LSQLWPLISGAGIPTPASAAESMIPANDRAKTALKSAATFFLIRCMVTPLLPNYLPAPGKR
jgi:hypothetical protein